MSEINYDDVIKKYIALRDARKELKEIYERQDSVLKDQIERIKLWILGKQREMGVTQFKTPHGIAFQQTRTIYSCADWGVFHQWITKNERLDFLEKRVGQRAIAEYREETNSIPPGLSCFSETEINIRKG